MKGTVGEGDVLFDELNEMQKVSFFEEMYKDYPGSFQVTVMSNPDQQTLDQWDRRRTTDDSLGRVVGDEILAGKSAKKLSFFEFDSYSTAIVGFHKGNIYYLHFTDFNPNDSEEERHQQIYESMVASFRFIE